MNCNPMPTTRQQLFLTGFLQVLFVAVNTVFIAKHFAAGVFLCAFLISLIWSWNVRRVVFGDLYDRVVYSLGAAFGSVAGMVVGVWVYELFTP